MVGLSRLADKDRPKKNKRLARKGKRGLQSKLQTPAGLEIERALNLRLAGMTFPQISKTMGLKGERFASALVHKAMGARIKEPTEQLRQIEIERFDAMLLSLATKVRAGDVQAIDRALKISAERRKLLGLDMPEKKELDGNVKFEWQMDERKAKEIEGGADGEF